jgi:hypothetical protein
MLLKLHFHGLKLGGEVSNRQLSYSKLSSKRERSKRLSGRCKDGLDSLPTDQSLPPLRRYMYNAREQDE